MNAPLPELISAKTHPPQYLLHKYWARKPHNVIGAFLESLVPEGGVVLDPYCGSGVVLREGAIRGLEAVGFDINPVAVLISNVTANPPKLDDFVEVVSPLVDLFEKRAFSDYGYSIDGQAIRYLVHEIIVICTQCGNETTPTGARRRGRTYECLDCGARLRFNLERLHDTRVVEAILDTDGRVVADHDATLEQKTLSESLSFVEAKQRATYDRAFAANRRTLAFEGLRTSHLFTPRNFSFMCEVADSFHAIEDDLVRNAALMLLTASVAQGSRLIPYRQRSSTGGPAWSVPGFWVPAVHLETNPAVHLRARLKKFERGLQALLDAPSTTTVAVSKSDATEGLSRFAASGRRAQLVFLDPPYGDSVPYLEFSSLWNSFLKESPSVDADISVSDRLEGSVAWERYESGLRSAIRAAKNALDPEGHILITFNNHDPRAWAALLGALETAGFKCEYVSYQVPAVVSSKAQFAPSGSYISDVYAVYGQAPTGFKPSHDLRPIKDALHRCASAREGQVARNVVLRATMVSWIANNLAAELLPERDQLIAELFEEKEDILWWRTELNSAVPKLHDVVGAVADRLFAVGNTDWAALYKAVATMMMDCAVPDPGEVRSALNGKFEPRTVSSKRKVRKGQLELL